MQNAIQQITTSISSLEQLTSKILQNQQLILSPGREKPVKRAKTTDTESTTRFQSIPADPMDATDQWEDPHPNMSPPHSRASSPSL